jgi:L-alanine-DL-glutamate epimerase-like enolase superfamily enzyme
VALKIVGAQVLICSPGRNFVTLKIETDDGIYGLGDATLNGRELAVASYLSASTWFRVSLAVTHRRWKTSGKISIVAPIGGVAQ